MNETLRQALFRAGLSDEAVAARLGVDPKTVRRWLDGRLPYPRLRWQLALLLKTDETVLWPGLAATRGVVTRPPEVVAIYPHRWSIPAGLRRQLLRSATREIAILGYSGLRIAEDASLVALLRSKAAAGLRVRIALGDPDWQEEADQASGIRRALGLYRPLLDLPAAQIRLHRTVQYYSMLMADHEILVSQHIHGIAAADSPVLHLSAAGTGELAGAYLDSFETIWASSSPVPPRSR
jgi:transcriptional regulator with XRE-family HTH domain